MTHLDIDFVFRPFAYIDCPYVQTSRPGSGPVGEGEGAPGKENVYMIQQAVRNATK